jgi:hypothetical protein
MSGAKRWRILDEFSRTINLIAKEEYAVKEDSVVEYQNPGIALPVADALTEVLRSGARELLQQAVEAEVAEFVACHRELKDERERQRVVRNGYEPERTIQTGIGDVPVKAPRVRDREGTIKFSSNILPRYLRRTKSIEELLPWLYLKGLSTGDFSSALTALLGRDAPGLSAATVSRLKEIWKEQYERWSKRSLAGKNYVYIWVDGVHFGVRLEDASQCILVVIGATADGKKELLAMGDGYRESESSWKELLLDLKARAHNRSETCRRRWRFGFLEGAAASVWHEEATLFTDSPIQAVRTLTRLHTMRYRRVRRPWVCGFMNWGIACRTLLTFLQRWRGMLLTDTTETPMREQHLRIVYLVDTSLSLEFFHQSHEGTLC